MSKPEYGKQCQRCHKRTKSRMYYRMIGEKYIRLCSECWRIVDIAYQLRQQWLAQQKEPIK